jgi:hypothetical protein
MIENIIWIPEEERKHYKEWMEKRKEDFIKIMWGTYVPPEPRVWNNVKIAWVMKDGKKKMMGVDNKTMQGYKMEKSIPTFKIPLEEETYDTFIRWCTSFDL